MSSDHRHWRRLPGPLHAEVLTPDVRVHATDTLAPLVLMHGFTQTRRSWDPFLDALDACCPSERPVIRVDLPGHGGSRGIAADLPMTADLVVETCGPGVYCGYSMGGRVALHVALQHPDDTHALITIGATPGIEDREERRQRRDADDALASTIEDIGTKAFIDQWLAQPMFDRLPRTQADLAERHSNTATGLATSLRLAGTGTQESLWPQLTALTMPVLLLAGALDLKFLAIADRMADAIGDNARAVHIVDAGHSAHLEQPERVATVFGEFLQPLG